MTDDTKESDAQRIITEAINAVTTAAGAIVLASPGDGTTAGVLSVLPQTMAWIYGATVNAKRSRVVRWWHETVAKDWPDGTTAEEIAGTIDAHKDEPFVRETIFQSVRSIFEATDDAIVTPLAMLAREYLRKHRPTDSFFRGTCRLLTELSSAEFEQLVRFLRTCARHDLSREDRAVIRSAAFSREDEIGLETRDGVIPEANVPDSRHIVSLLARSGLAEDMPRQPRGPARGVMTIEDFNRLVVLLTKSSD